MAQRYPRFSAFAVPSWEVIDRDLPIQGAVITEAENTPSALDGMIDRQYAHLVTNFGSPSIQEGETVIVADRGWSLDAFIVDGIADEDDQETLTITAGGLASYAKDQPWLPASDAVRDALDAMHARIGTRTLESGAEAGGIGWRRSTDELVGVEVDPLDIVRAIWVMLLTPDSANLRLVIDDTLSDARIGEEERDVEFTTDAGEDVEFTAGPRRWNWYSSHDMGKEIDDLAEETPFSWWEETRWNGGLPDTRLRLEYPARPSPRRDNLLFETGVNVHGVDGVSWAEYANAVLVVGQGEGSEARRGYASIEDGRLRRVHVEVDRSLRSNTRCDARAKELLKTFVERPVINQITVEDHPAARFGTFGVGDTITVRGRTGWAELGQGYRIISRTHDMTAGSMQVGVEEVARG